MHTRILWYPSQHLRISRIGGACIILRYCSIAIPIGSDGSTVVTEHLARDSGTASVPGPAPMSRTEDPGRNLHLRDLFLHPRRIAGDNILNKPIDHALIRSECTPAFTYLLLLCNGTGMLLIPLVAVINNRRRHTGVMRTHTVY